MVWLLGRADSVLGRVLLVVRVKCFQVPGHMTFCLFVFVAITEWKYQQNSEEGIHWIP